MKEGRKGRKERREGGRKEGRNEGRKEGRKEGREEGRKAGREETDQLSLAPKILDRQSSDQPL